MQLVELKILAHLYKSFHNYIQYIVFEKWLKCYWRMYLQACMASASTPNTLLDKVELYVCETTHCYCFKNVKYCISNLK